MEKFPVIKIRKEKVMKDDVVIKKDVINFIEKIAKEFGGVYIIDVDGYKKNEANFRLYKKIAVPIWLDAYPRYVEDVMDLVIISGVNKITVRNMEEEMLKEIKDMIEKEIYLAYNNALQSSYFATKYGFKGVVLDEWQEIGGNIETWKLHLKEYVIRRVR